MAAASIDTSQVFSLSTAEYGRKTIRATQVGVLAAAIWPAETVSISQEHILAVGASSNTTEVSQAFVLAACIGRVSDPHVRAWTYTLDGHDFYVVRLGNDETLVYDLMTQQWSTFSTGYSALWRAFNGQNWLGADRIAAGYGSNVIVGDDGNGSLYFLDPDGDFDDDALTGSETPREYERAVIGQIVAHGYDAKRCFGVTVLGSIGTQLDSSDDYRTVNLAVSDDAGRTYIDSGDLTVPAEEYSTRLNWRSLGSIRYPGRLFKISDTGALRRIDGMDVDDGT